MDSEQEVDQVARLAASIGKTALTAIRVKPTDLTYFETFTSDHFPTSKSNYAEELKSWKWGIGEAGIKRIIERVNSIDHVELIGYHCHVGRSGRQVEYYEAWNRAYAKLVAGIYQDTGFAPKFVDLGGGWARERDPESGSRERNPHTIEDYAKAVCTAMQEEFEAVNMPIPEMWLEMGRYLIGNAGVLLTKVDLIKTDPETGRSWTHVDAHTMLALSLEFLGNANHVTLATGMHRSDTQRTNIVGPICITANWTEDADVPDLDPGDIVAILDMGMYGEQLAVHFNSMPKPASVLVHDGKSELIRRRETLEDVFATQVLPERLKPAAD
jgi:diaminopimelate decarboxylase